MTMAWTAHVATRLGSPRLVPKRSQGGSPRTRLWILSSALVLAAFTSCRGSAGDALLIGRLYGEATVGCVWIGRPSGGLEVDWPSGVSHVVR